MKNGRLTLLLIAASGWLILIGWRLYQLQVLEHEDFRARAEGQQQDVVVLSPPRGTIYDARGRQLAVSVEASSVAAHPSMIEDPEAVTAALGQVINANEKLTAGLASKKKFVWIKRKLDPVQASMVRELGLEGVFLLRESKRYYPLSRLAAQILGYVGTDNSGLAGLEFLYDAVVTSDPGQRTVVRDAKRGTVLYPNLDEAAPKPGKDLRLTLDAAIQHLVERELQAAIASSGARHGIIVVMEPTTGAVLAMASHPSFDPNDFASSPRSHWRNSAVQDAFEPGSTFKMVTLAAALEANMVDPLETIDCEMGGITLNGVRIADHTPFGQLTTRQIIAQSSNVGAIKLGAAAGRERLYRTIQAFGFGRPTGIDLPSESSGILRPLDRWTQLSPAYISFGHAISATALQLTNAFAAIANGGRLMKPYIVDSIGDGKRHQPQVAGWPIAPSSVNQVRSMLESVVLEGTAKTAAIEGYRAAGKTGTAQKVVPGRGYAAGKYIASFIGFAPVKKPALVAAVILDEPWPRYHGGEVAAPVFAKIARQALLYLDVPPEREDVPWVIASRDIDSEISSPVTSRHLPQEPTGTGQHDSMPDFVGLTARQAVALSADLGLQLNLQGHGSVTRQSPPPGTPLEADSTIEIVLERSSYAESSGQRPSGRLVEG